MAIKQPNIATPQHKTTSTPQYRLPEADRQAILSESDREKRFKKRLEKTERQRQVFIQEFGGDGTDKTMSTWYCLP